MIRLPAPPSPTSRRKSGESTGSRRNIRSRQMKQKEENIQGTEKEFIDLFKELTTSRSDWQDPVPISGEGLAVYGRIRK